MYTKWTEADKAEGLRALQRRSGELRSTVKALQLHDNVKWAKMTAATLSRWCQMAAKAQRAADYEEVLPRAVRGRPAIFPRVLRDELTTTIMRMIATGIAVDSTLLRPRIIEMIEAKGYGHILDDNGGEFTVSASWINEKCRALRLPMRKKTTDSQLPADWELQLDRFAYRLAYIVFVFDIPLELVIGWDQTGCFLVPAMDRGRAKKGATKVSFVGAGDKRQITLIPGFIGEVMLPAQVIFTGKTLRSLPRDSVRGPFEKAGMNVTMSANHWSTEETMQEYFNVVLAPAFKKVRGRIRCSRRVRCEPEVSGRVDD